MAPRFDHVEKRRHGMRTSSRQSRIAALLVVAGALALVAQATAQPKPNVFDDGNRWLISDYNDCDPTHPLWATQGICFLPYERCSACGVTGVWYSDTYPGWRGRYFQEGDHLAMHGNWADFGGSDGMIFELFAGPTPRDEAAGHWTEWFNTGSFGTTVVFANARLQRVGKCSDAGTDISKLTAAQIDKLVVELSNKVKPRYRRDGKPATSPSDPEQTPLPEQKR